MQSFKSFDTIRQHLHELQPDITSPLLEHIISDMPDVGVAVRELESSFDIDLAKSTGKLPLSQLLSAAYSTLNYFLFFSPGLIQLHKGSNEHFDAATNRKREAEMVLNELLMKERASIQCQKMKFLGSGKIPEPVLDDFDPH